MTSTTIKVDVATRDRLKVQAAAAHLTLGQHLARLADAADRADRLEALRAAVAATPATARESWADEAQAWESAELADGGR
ncbi:hypothetical protein GCM10027047_06470 [Rhodococcus aerolatus]